jgi:hypothetical protein
VLIKRLPKKNLGEIDMTTVAQNINIQIDTANVFTLSLHQIDRKIDINPRVGLDEEHVQRLMADPPGTYPPIQVMTMNGGASWVIVDGSHRVEAATRLKVYTLQAVKVTGTLTDYDKDHPEDVPAFARIAAFRANASHGLPLSNDERKDYAYLLYIENAGGTPNWVQIGRQVKLDPKTVKAHCLKVDREQERTQEEEETDGEEQVRYNRAVTDYTAKLVSSLNKFFEHERATFGAIDGKRSETLRAKAITRNLQGTDENIKLMTSLARTFEQAADLLAEKANEE